MTGSTDNEPEILIDDITFEKGSQTICITMDYSKKIKWDDEKHKLVIGKFKPIDYLLRGAKHDKKRKLTFKWTIQFEEHTYVYDFDSNGEPFNQRNITYNGDKLDLYPIPKL
jgi:hypothetical protein